MDTPPLHPQLIAERQRGDAFIERVAQARRSIGSTRVTVTCDDGDNRITFDGYGMVVAAEFADDLFDRYTEAELGDLLTAMCAEGYAKLERQVTTITGSALQGPQ